MYQRFVTLSKPLPILFIFFLLMLSASFAKANSIYPSDDGGFPKDYFYANEAVYVSGDLDPYGQADFIVPRARVYVTEDLAWEGWEAIQDVSLHGYYSGYNVVVGNMAGGSFLGALVWGPPLKVGNYDLIIDEEEDGLYDPAKDLVIGAGVGGVPGTGFAFTVLAPEGPNVNLFDMKKSAENMAKYYEGYANRTSSLVNATRGQAFSPLITITKASDKKESSTESGFSGSQFVSLKTYGEVASVVESAKAGYDSTVIAIGFKILRNLANAQKDKYKTMAADPPDPNYTQITPLGELEFTYMFGNSSMELAQVALSNELAKQSAIIAALTSSIEKYTGARNAEADYFTLMQAKAAKEYADMAVQSLGNIKQLLINLRSEIQAGGFEKVLNANDIAVLKAFQQRVKTNGFTASEIAILKAGGMTDAEVKELKDEIIATDYQKMQDISMAGVLDALAASNDQDKSYFANLAQQFKSVVDYYSQYVKYKHPKANPGGPYSGNVGVPIIFDGSASTNPIGTNQLKYEWDFDGDGEFDDAVGPKVQYTWKSAFSGLVGLKVTNIPKAGAPIIGFDPFKLSNIAYAYLEVKEVNRPPVITSVTPENFSLVLPPNTQLLFNATANDPDNDPITYNWILDGVLASTGSQWTYTPKPGDVGMHDVYLKVSDNNPDSRDTFEAWRVFVNNPPNAVDDVYSVNADRVLDVPKPGVLANDKDLDNQPLSVIGTDTTGTIGLVTVNGDGSFFYDTNARFDNLLPGQKATDKFTYTASDNNGGTDTATVTINITGVQPNTPPKAVDDDYSVDANKTLDIPPKGMLSNDRDVDGDPLTVISADLSKTIGMVTWQSDGSFFYNPNGKFDYLKGGEKFIDSFTYTISDGRRGKDTATVTINITGINELPDAVNDLYFVNSNSFLLINAPGVLANDKDIDNDPLKITNVDTSKTLGIAKLNVNGSLFYDPNGKFDYLGYDQIADDEFSYTISDGNGGIDTATVTIKITGVGSLPPSLEVDEAIKKGLAWLASQQKASGNFGSHYDLGSAAAAVLAFEEQGHLPGKNTMYSTIVEKGLNFIFSKIYIQSINVQPAGDPDSDGDGIGVYFSDDGGMYETGLCMLAIVASKSPDRIVETGKCKGWTYYDVMVDAVDWLSWAQNESGSGRGGWRYTPNRDDSDNSVSQWPVLGMMAAEKWNIFAPGWVKDELNIWVNFVQNPNGCSGYTGPDSIVNLAKTGALLVEFHWLRDPLNSPRVQKAINCINSKWGEQAYSEYYGNMGNPYAMFSVYKGLALLGLDTLPGSPDIDWWDDYKRFIVDTQIPEGTDKGFWKQTPGSYSYGTWLTTGWYISILQGTFFPGTIFVNLPDCVCEDTGYMVEIEYSYENYKGFGVLNVYKDGELFEIVDLIDFQGTNTYTRYIESDTPGKHTWKALMYLATEDGKTVRAEGESSLNVYMKPKLADIPDQTAPFKTFDLDDYILRASGVMSTIKWSATPVPEGWTLTIDQNNVVTIKAPEKVQAKATVTFTARVDTACQEVVCSASDDVTFTSYPPTLSDIPNVQFFENGSDSSIDLDDYVVDNSPDEAIKWTFAGNDKVKVEISPETRIVTFSSGNEWSGAEVIQFTATDPDGLWDSRSMTVTVIPLPRPTGYATYDVPNTLLTIKFNKQIRPDSICFSGIGMEVGDSGKKDFQLSSNPDRDLKAREKGPAQEVNIDINRDHPTTVNLAVNAFVSHKKVDLLMDEGTVIDVDGLKNPQITGDRNIRIKMMANGLVIGTKGDVDGNDDVNIYDAGLVLKASLKGMETLPIYIPCQEIDKQLDAAGHKCNTAKYMADWDGNGNVDSNDASQILKWVVGNKVEAAPEAISEPKVGELSLVSYKNGKLNVSLDLNNVRGVYSADIVLAYDTSSLKVSRVTNAYGTSAWLMEELSEKGKVMIAMAGSDQPIENGSMVNIIFDANSANDMRKINIIDFRLNGGKLKTEIKNLPKSFALLQNYPNPFNPETWIPYQLSEPSHVIISIYNANGQIVRRLDLGNKLPGYYIDAPKAAYWDGKNEIGEAVTSGIYFYQLQAGNESSVKKMILVK